MQPDSLWGSQGLGMDQGHLLKLWGFRVCCACELLPWSRCLSTGPPWTPVACVSSCRPETEKKGCCWEVQAAPVQPECVWAQGLGGDQVMT